MVVVPGGDFLRGRTHDWPDTRLKWYPNPLKDDVPVGPVVLDSFLMDEAEVTNRKYLEFVRETGHRPPFHWIDGVPRSDAGDQPVANVSWDDATAYCAWVDKRLPTEAEWEKAARGTDGRSFPWGDEPPGHEHAIWKDHPTALESTAPVKCCAEGASPYGAHNMAGNVYEWCEDVYAKDFYSRSPKSNPVHNDEGRYRVLRGGALVLESEYLRSALRYRLLPLDRTPYIGFRAALSQGKR